VGNDKQILSLVRYHTNVIEIAARTMLTESTFMVKIILNILSNKTSYFEHSNLQVSYRDGVGIKKSFYYRIVSDVETGNVRIEPEPLKGYQKGGIIKVPEKPIPLKPGAKR
jgi:hypothetical protein